MTPDAPERHDPHATRPTDTRPDGARTMSDLESRSMLVTGAASGIGLAMCRPTARRRRLGRSASTCRTPIEEVDHEAGRFELRHCRRPGPRRHRGGRAACGRTERSTRRGRHRSGRRGRRGGARPGPRRVGPDHLDQPDRHLRDGQATRSPRCSPRNPNRRRRRRAVARHRSSRSPASRVSRAPRGKRLQRVQGRRGAAHQEPGDRLRAPGDPLPTRSAPGSSRRR